MSNPQWNWLREFSAPILCTDYWWHLQDPSPNTLSSLGLSQKAEKWSKHLSKGKTDCSPPGRPIGSITSSVCNPVMLHHLSLTHPVVGHLNYEISIFDTTESQQISVFLILHKSANSRFIVIILSQEYGNAKSFPQITYFFLVSSIGSFKISSFQIFLKRLYQITCSLSLPSVSSFLLFHREWLDHRAATLIPSSPVLREIN